MKITIDTDQTPHRIEVKGQTTLGELIEFLSKYYPDFTWKDLRLGDGTMFNLGDWGKQTYTPHQPSPWVTQPIIYGSTGITTIPAGTYTSAVRDSKSAVDLFDTADNMGIRTKQ